MYYMPKKKLENLFIDKIIFLMRLTRKARVKKLKRSRGFMTSMMIWVYIQSVISCICVITKRNDIYITSGPEVEFSSTSVDLG